MKIGGYANFNQTRDPMPGLDKKTPESARAALPLLGQENLDDHRQNLISSDTKRAQVQTYLDNIKQYRERLFHLQKEGKALENAQNKLTALQGMLSGEGKDTLPLISRVTKIRGELSAHYRDVEEIQSEIVEALSDLDRLKTPEGTASHESALARALEHVETARENLSKKQEIIQEKLAGTLVAMENLTAAQSLIRDAEGASRVMDQLKGSITKNVDHSMLSQANLNRNYILGLIK